MGPRDRAQGEDDGDQGSGGCGCVFEQLEPDVMRAQPLGCDPRADNGRQEEGGADPLGQQSPAEVRLRHPVLCESIATRSHGILADNSSAVDSNALLRVASSPSTAAGSARLQWI